MTKRHIIPAFFLVALLGSGGAAVAAAQQAEPPAGQQAPVRQRATGSDSAFDRPGDLRPGDIVRLWIWREKDMSGDYPVDRDGMVVLPRIGPQRVTGITTDSLRSRLVELYRRYLRNPSIDVVVLRRVNVMGAVRSPGLYPVDPTMTITDALALAGGATPTGRTDQVELRRDGDVLTAHLSGSTRLADTPIQSGDQLFVPERSWVSRNMGLVSTIISSATSILVTLLIINNR